MPIDFDQTQDFTAELSPKIVNQSFYNAPQKKFNFFTKTIVDSDYAGMKISKKSFGKLQSTKQKTTL